MNAGILGPAVIMSCKFRGSAALSASNSCLGDVLRKECSRACKHDARLSSAKKFRRFASFYLLGSICSGPQCSC